MSRVKAGRPQVHPWVAAYRAGSSARQVADQFQSSERTVRRALQRAGEPLRVRGTQPLTIDGREVAALRGAGITWAQIARQCGCSPHGARGAMIRAGAITTSSIRAADRRSLAAAVRRVPGGRGARYDLDSREGTRMLTLMRRLRRQGATLDDLAAIAGVATITISRWISATRPGTSARSV